MIITFKSDHIFKFRFLGQLSGAKEHIGKKTGQASQCSKTSLAKKTFSIELDW